MISTFAGTGSSGYIGDGVAATSTTLYFPLCVALDVSGRKTYFISIFTSSHVYVDLYCTGNVYIADYFNNRIRKVTVSTGIISTIAGTGAASFSGDNGAAISATLNGPSGITVDSSGK